jgi:hypothetical protein
VADNPIVKAKTTLRAERLSPNRIGIGLAVVLALSNLALLAVSLSQRREIGSLHARAQEIDDNLVRLQRAEAEGLQSLEGDLAAARDEVESLKASFPEIGAGFDIYSRGFELAEAAGARLDAISRMGTCNSPAIICGPVRAWSPAWPSSRAWRMRGWIQWRSRASTSIRTGSSAILTWTSPARGGLEDRTDASEA